MNLGTKARLCTLLGLTALIAAASGCAGGGLLDRSIVGADLPDDAPAAPYPTAVRSAAASSDRQAAVANSPNSQTPSVIIPHSRQDHPQPLLTPLAVIPPELVRV